MAVHLKSSLRLKGRNKEWNSLGSIFLTKKAYPKRAGLIVCLLAKISMQKLIIYVEAHRSVYLPLASK